MNNEEQEQTLEPESVKKHSGKQTRNILILFLFCLVIGGGGAIWLTEPKVESQESVERSLDTRLRIAAGSQKHPDLANRRNYQQDFAQKVETDVDQVEGRLDDVKQTTDMTTQELQELRNDFAQLSVDYQRLQQQIDSDKQNLAVRLDVESSRIDQALNQSPTGLPQAAKPDTPTTIEKPKRGFKSPSQDNNTRTPTRQPRTMEATTFELTKTNYNNAKRILDTANYLPPGSYAKGRIIVGAKVSAALGAQDDPRPILIRVMGNAKGPIWSSEHIESDVDGCTVTASAYGDLSSEQGHAKLQELSCAVGPNKARSTRVYGYISERGSYGISADVVERTGDLAERAFWAGMLETSGGALDTLIGSSSTSAFGVVNTSGGAEDAAKELVSGGLKKSGDQLSSYYIKKLERIQPVLPLKAGTDVVIVFMKGVSLDGSELNVSPQQNTRIKLEDNNKIAPSTINQALIKQVLNGAKNQQVDATQTDWNNELY